MNPESLPMDPIAAAEQYRQRVESASQHLQTQFPATPNFGVILGSGLGALTQEIEQKISIPYDQIPGFPASTAPGHSGNLHFGKIGDQSVIAFEGRFHSYEGYSPADITLPVRVMARLGVQNMIITNACGGMNLKYKKGDLMIIEDHIDMLSGNPLTGLNFDEWGPRFPDMYAPYHPELMNQLLKIAEEENIRAHKGVYVAVSGPNLETRAEYRMLRNMGADVVGMSTVPEVIVAVHEGLNTAGISVVTDVCDPDNLEPVSVDEILAVAAEAEPKLTKLVLRLIAG